MRPLKIKLVLKMLLKENIDSEYCSPNFVADFARNRKVYLKSNEVVYISNTFENKRNEAK